MFHMPPHPEPENQWKEAAKNPALIGLVMGALLFIFAFTDKTPWMGKERVREEVTALRTEIARVESRNTHLETQLDLIKSGQLTNVQKIAAIETASMEISRRLGQIETKLDRQYDYFRQHPQSSPPPGRRFPPPNFGPEDH